MTSLIKKYELEKYIPNFNSQDYARAELSKVIKSLDELKQEKKEFFPFEKPLGNQLEKFLEKKEYELNIQSETGATKIDLSFLSKTKDFEIQIRENEKITLDLPIFAVYGKENLFKIVIDNLGSFGYTRLFQQKVPYEINKSYEEFIKKDFSDEQRKSLKQCIPENRNRIEATSEFYGFVPNEVKKKLISTRKYFEEDIYLIAEADYSFAKIEKDPLIIGFDKKNEEAYLLACFDCTPLENYIAEEFALNKAGRN